MLTDKQSLILCFFVMAGFLISGIFDILDNYIVIAVLVIAFLVVLINMIKVASTNYENKESTSDSSE